MGGRHNALAFRLEEGNLSVYEDAQLRNRCKSACGGMGCSNPPMVDEDFVW